MLLQCLFTILLVSQHACGDSGPSEPFQSDTARRHDQQERLLVNQTPEVTTLKCVLDQQLLDLLREQSAAITSLQRLLKEQSAAVISQQRLLKQQSAELASYKHLLQSQNVRLHLVEDVLSIKADQPGRTKRMPFLNRDNLTDHEENNSSRKVNSKQQTDVLIQKDVSGLLFQPVSHRQRADDPGPLEAVVNQLSHQMTSTAADLQALKTSVSQQEQLIQDARTSTFVRWGNAQCGSASELVYSGVVGGSRYTESGGAANFLCLTLSPVFGDHKTTEAHVYGAEYETLDSVYDKDPVCAVCRTAYSTTVMIPGTNVCTPGWHPQYSGYLMAGAADHAAASEFICVDSSLQYQMHSDQDDNGKLLYYTATRCGSLPCAPYVNDMTVLCVVCSK